MITTLIIFVQVLAAMSLIVAIVTSIWSLILQKKEVTKQNKKIIQLLTEIKEKIKWKEK